MKIDFVKNKFKFLILPAVIILAGIIGYFVNGGFNFDIEFMGGSKMQIAWENAAPTDEVKSYLETETGIKPLVVQTTSTGISIKTTAVEDEQRVLIFNTLKAQYGLADDALLSTNSASASFGGRVQRKAFIFTAIAVLLILAYIAIRFEWRSAVMAVAALLLNILVMMSVYSVFYIPLNTTFIAAMLTVVGYSINNTIVVFDRVRENMKKLNAKRGNGVSAIVNTSISESMGRTINTTITTLVTIVLLYVIGVTAVKEFAFPLIVGVIAGAYSSIFFASPFWAAWKEAEAKNKK